MDSRMRMEKDLACRDLSAADASRDEPIRFTTGECSLGSVLVAATERGICAILLGDDSEALVLELEERFPEAGLIDRDQDVERLLAKVVRFIEAPSLGLDVPLDPRGTAFEQKVWQALREIPAGETASYTEIAERIGAPKEAFAVGQACATNAIAVAIPCHRVVRKDGSLAGYRWGFKRKRALLEREAAMNELICIDLSSLFDSEFSTSWCSVWVAERTGVPTVDQSDMRVGYRMTTDSSGSCLALRSRVIALPHAS